MFFKNDGVFLGKQYDLLGIILVLTIASYYLFVFIQQISTILDLRLLHEEFRQLFPYYQINEPELFKDDYITSFYLGGNQPILLLIDAYSATDKKPIKKLKDSFGVNYLLVEKRHFYKENPGPKYFALFHNDIKNVWETRKTEGFLLSDATLQGKVFETENYYILNINDFISAEKPH